jgi:hypothetical protein
MEMQEVSLIIGHLDLLTGDFNQDHFHLSSAYVTSPYFRPQFVRITGEAIGVWFHSIITGAIEETAYSFLQFLKYARFLSPERIFWTNFTRYLDTSQFFTNGSQGNTSWDFSHSYF